MVQIFPIEKQGRGAFNGGEIVENKPVGFPQDHSTLRPFSNLFYWAHARAVTDSTIGLHPHQGFEICSFVLKGQIRHFDTKLRQWIPLEAGDVQIIRAGNGISHSEFMAEGSEMFQIWFDPNLEATLSKPASYDDYRAANFPKKNSGEGILETVLLGGDSPFKMDSQGVTVSVLDLGNATFSTAETPGRVFAAYVLEGEVLVNGELAKTTDFALASGLQTLEIQSLANSKVFLMGLPENVGYRTYGQLMRA